MRDGEGVGVFFWCIGQPGGGSALPRGMGWGAMGAAGAVSAQNQPIVRIYVEIQSKAVTELRRKMHCW